ncbi:hypothetical protein Tco_1098893 [Tanacetum coccineum]
MRTRSQSRRRRQQQTPPVVVENFDLEEPIVDQNIVAMADNRTMAQMLQAPIEGYEDAIVVPQINANNFELKLPVTSQIEKGFITLNLRLQPEKSKRLSVECLQPISLQILTSDLQPDIQCSPNDSTVNPSLSNMLHKSVFIYSNTIISQDRRVQSYCGLKLADIPAASSDRSKAKKEQFQLRSVPAAYHNLGPPSYQCSSYHATMWYDERNDKARRAINPTFSICCQEGKVILSRFNKTPLPLKKLLDYNDPTTSRFKDQIKEYNGIFVSHRLEPT